MSTQLTTSATTGSAVVWGNNVGISYSTGSIVDGDNLPQSSTYTKDGDEQEIRDAIGEVQTFVTYNKRETCDIEVIPIGGTIAAAEANNVCPAKGETVTISNSDGSHSELAGDWICITSTQTASNTAETRISMSLRRYAAGVITPPDAS